MRLEDTKDMVVQALVAQITVDGIIGLDCLRSNAFPAYVRLTRLPSTSNILFCKSIKPAFDLKQSKPIIPSTDRLVLFKRLLIPTVKLMKKEN
jgi:hypothetical protein